METMQIMGNDQYISMNGVTICYDDLGTGMIPVLFIHGFPFDKSSWQPQMEFLKNTHRVIAYDIRGFGKSTAGNEIASINLFADDLIKLMDALLINKAFVCGLSMGGYILLNAVYRYPERFEGIILCDTQCLADSPATKEKRYKSITQIKEGGLKNYAETFVINVFCRETLVSKKELVEKIKDVIVSTSPLTITQSLRALADRREMCTSLNEISIPALILCGKEDAANMLAQAEYLNQHIANSTLHIIERAGHLSNLEQPDEFNQLLSDFISGMGIRINDFYDTIKHYPS
jgi:3-oxoadipate enol-lactonase